MANELRKFSDQLMKYYIQLAWYSPLIERILSLSVPVSLSVRTWHLFVPQFVTQSPDLCQNCILAYRFVLNTISMALLWEVVGRVWITCFLDLAFVGNDYWEILSGIIKCALNTVWFDCMIFNRYQLFTKHASRQRSICYSNLGLLTLTWQIIQYSDWGRLEILPVASVLLVCSQLEIACLQMPFVRKRLKRSH